MNLKYFSIFLSLMGLVTLFGEVHLFIIALSLFVFLVGWLSFIPKLALNIFKIFILVAALAFLWNKFHSFFVTEFGISLILVLSFLKTLELNTKEDYFNMFLILILLESCLFVSNPSLIIFFLGVVKIFIYFYFLLKLREVSLNALNVKRIFILIFPAVLFSLVLYFTFPRFTQGFIGYTGNDFLSSTGNTNLNISKLGAFTPSDKKLFRILNFPMQKNGQRSLYWRTNYLWDFRKGQWRSGVIPFKSEAKSFTFAYPVNYKIKTELIYMDFIPLFDSVNSATVEKRNVTYYSDNSFKLFPPSRATHLINATTDLSHKRELSAKEIDKASVYPLEMVSNFKNKVLTSQLTSLTNSDKAKAAIAYFTNKKFQYSLSPPAYKSIEDFIEFGKLGYCSHFAAALAFLFRAVEVPSRVVIGYQGGEINSFDNSILIRERDSHAWVEYLGDNQQWIRIDPTELVAPARTSLSSNLFFDQLNNRDQSQFLKITSVFSNNFITNNVDQFISYIDNSVSSSLFFIDYNDQKKILSKFSGLYFVLSLVVFLFVIYFLYIYSTKKRLNPIEKNYFELLNDLEKRGVKKMSFESANEFRARAVLSIPTMGDKINSIIDQYILFFYR